MDPSFDERRMAHETAHTLDRIVRAMNCLCIPCILDAEAEAEMLTLGLGNMDIVKRRLEQARERIAACPPVAHMVELIDSASKMLDRGEYGRAVQLMDEIIELLLSVRLEELSKYV
jgi:hypothetical protein